MVKRKRIKLINCDKNDIEKTVKILQNQISDSFKKNESFLKIMYKFPHLGYKQI